MISNAPGSTGPHTSHADFRSTGTRSSTRLPSSPASADRRRTTIAAECRRGQRPGERRLDRAAPRLADRAGLETDGASPRARFGRARRRAGPAQPESFIRAGASRAQANRDQRSPGMRRDLRSVLAPEAARAPRPGSPLPAPRSPSTPRPPPARPAGRARPAPPRLSTATRSGSIADRTRAPRNAEVASIAPKPSSHVPLGRWDRMEAHRGLGDDPEGAERPDEELRHVVAAHRFHHARAAPRDRPVGLDEAHAEEEIAGATVAVAQRPVAPVASTPPTVRDPPPGGSRGSRCRWRRAGRRARRATCPPPCSRPCPRARSRAGRRGARSRARCRGAEADGRARGCEPLPRGPTASPSAAATATTRPISAVVPG